jgi:hypothetical protein
MPIATIKPNAKIDASDLAHFEASLGFQLPPDYRAFLLSYNGGTVEPNTFSIRSGDSGSGVRAFFGLFEEARPGDLRYENSLMKARVAEGVMIIGSADGGNFVCVSLRQDTFGQIYFWDHEFEEDEGTVASFSNLFLIGASFREFLQKLSPFNPDQLKLQGTQVKRRWINPSFLRSLNTKKANDG